MPVQMNHIDRVKAALKGAPVDRPPASMWRHFYNLETSTDGTVKSLVDFQRRYDWDYMKVNVRAQYHAEDWGATYVYPGGPYDSPHADKLPVKKAADWARLKPLDPTKGALGAHLEVLRRINAEFKGQVPLLMTVFGPLGVASKLVESDDVLSQHMKEDPKSVKSGLEAITQTFAAYVPKCLEAGASGLFFATTGWGTYDRINDLQFDEFSRPYDLRVLAAARPGWFNVLHVCKSHNMLRRLADYPVQAFNWDSLDPTNPTLRDGLSITTRAVIGGIPQKGTEKLTPQDAKRFVDEAMTQTGGRRFLLGTGCTFSPRTPDAVVAAFKQAVDALSAKA